ncbi:potassium/proton antiporter [Marinobacterium iners]|uniref:Potassium/proton antiporter, CPA1 family n=1 Tax=Marinobacterium iners DSM 11526 TaxID=1122198 RepID=A0A1H3XGS1_9GAMM|nr:potassium/proton antiporter [Marinobacterium iners]SDZ98625.1 potassium/proton antiporter, CPA1 family [Marinobacterium iners DSM 11526]
MILTLLFASAMLLISILLSPLSNRIGMPVLLLFLGVGLLAGQTQMGQNLSADVESTFFVGHLALAIILLDGGMRTRIETFRVGLRPALALATFGVVITAAVTGLAAWWILELPLLHALLIGTIISSTDAAAVFALLQNHGLRLNQRVSATLEIESGSNDPMAIFLTIILLELITRDTPPGVAEAALLLGKQLALGALGGLAGGWAMARLLPRLDLQPAFYPLLVTAAGLTVFSVVYLLDGSGFLAIYLMGILIGNRGLRKLDDILQVHDGLAWLAQLSLFLMLGLLLSPHDKLAFVPEGIALGAVLILLARPLSIALTLWPFGFRWREQLFIAWVGLRGAVPIVLALFPLMAGLDNAALFPTIAFIVVIMSLLLQGTTLARVARWLKLELPAEPEAMRRLSLEWSMEQNHRVWVFELDGEHWTPARTLQGVKLPGNIVISAVLRGRELLPWTSELKLQSGDRLAVIGNDEAEKPLARLFSSVESIPALKERTFFGAFELNANIELAALAQNFGVAVPPDQAEQQLSEYIRERLHTAPVVGDRVPLGAIELVVKAVEAGQVTRVGLKF